MNLQAQIESLAGFSGKWNEQGTVFRADPLVYGYLIPVQRIEIEAAGVHLLSSPITNTEWWHQFMPLNGCPRYKGQLVEIPDRYDPFCQAGKCDEACGAEDGFVDLSAGRLRLIEDAEAVAQKFPRLHAYLQRAEQLTQAARDAEGVSIMLDTSLSVVDLRARIQPDPDNLARHLAVFKQLYPQITQIHDKVNTAFLPQPKDFSDVTITEESILEEARFYALQEGVRQEALDMLNFLVTRKGGNIVENEYHLPQEQMVYTLLNHRIEATRNGLYMGTEGFSKGVQEVQKFFQTTLGGGRW